MKIRINCEYCGSAYEWEEGCVCPNCAASPTEEQLREAEKYAEEHSDKKTGKFMRFLIKGLPVWLAGFVLFNILNIVLIEHPLVINPADIQDLSTVTYKTVQMNESVTLSGAYDIKIEKAFIADTPAVKAIVPQNLELLVLYASRDNIQNKDFRYDTYNGSAYVTNGRFCNTLIESYYLDTIPESFVKSSFSLSTGYFNENTGYMCFFIEKGERDLTLCLEDTDTQSKMRYINSIIQIPLTITEESI